MNDDERQAELELVVAQLWCLPQHSHKEMDVEFSRSIVALLQSREAAVLEDVRAAYLRWCDTCVPQAGHDHPPIRFDDWLRAQAQERRS